MKTEVLVLNYGMLIIQVEVFVTEMVKCYCIITVVLVEEIS